MGTLLRFTTTRTRIGPAGSLVWEVGTTGTSAIIAAIQRHTSIDVVPCTAVREPSETELADRTGPAPF